jgi:hypothetical protein
VNFTSYRERCNTAMHPQAHGSIIRPSPSNAHAYRLLLVKEQCRQFSSTPNHQLFTTNMLDLSSASAAKT